MQMLEYYIANNGLNRYLSFSSISVVFGKSSKCMLLVSLSIMRFE